MSGFSNLGFGINVGPLVSTPGDVTDPAVNSNVRVIGVSSQAAGYLYLFPDFRDELSMRRIRRRTKRRGWARGGGGGRIGRGRGG